ncbi:sulfocyanin-like copper-binding protein [Kitasatospora sp. NPDC101155]|uniref:sulfocyanin-like copper-binding protein n=1 Tax=Kitasatospora sp. NPDC101155 TaxID=3364097 RepID=UPI00382D6213
MNIHVANRRGGWLVVLVGAVAALVLGIATTALFATMGPFHGTGPGPWQAPAARCDAPALPGRVIDVTTSDMGPGMTGGGPHSQVGMMRLHSDANTVPTGQLSLRIFNAGALTHEVIVLPLSAGQRVGDRPVGSEGRVDETGSLAEALRTCGSGTGDGIRSGAVAWTTMTLQPGRYELVCNFPGHYAAGMYTELDVTSP